MTTKPGDSVAVQFTISDPATGGRVNADSLPTGTLVRNGDNTAETVTITNISTGVYKAAATIPAGYVAGDEVQLRIGATVSTVAAEATVWGDTLDSKRNADLQDLTAAQVNAEADQALSDYDAPTKAELDAAEAVVTTAIDGLNDLDAAEVQAVAGAALTSYDPPTSAEMLAAFAALNNISAADVWEHAVRTLTANVNGVTIVSAVSGNAISVYEYATWNFTITDSALALTDYENLIFVVKDNFGDTDNESILLVDITTGLERIGQAAPTNANLGSVVKDSATSFTVLVAMSEVAAKIGSNYAGVRTWQLKGIDTTDDPDEGYVLIEGNFVIKGGKARAII